MGSKIKGVILAGGFGTRLLPLTHITNKHLLPVYDRPMVLYPLETLKKGGITEVLVVSAGQHAAQFRNFLDSNAPAGLQISYAAQEGAGGIADALRLAEDFAAGSKTAVILGDNLFDADLSAEIRRFGAEEDGAKIFIKEVTDPQRFGVAEILGNKVVNIEEKPKNPKSNYAVVGLYLYGPDVFEKIKALTPSARGELEVTDLNNLYIKEGRAQYGVIEGAWFDAGTFDSLLAASNWFAKHNG
jgi:glucose-1-phosphate thymidylyltransferase